MVSVATNTYDCGVIMIRLSSYAILSSRLENGGYALLNGRSGAIDIINEDFHRILADKIETCNPHSIYFDRELFPDDLFTQFFERGHLVSVPHEAEKEQVVQIANLLHERDRKQLSIVIAPDTDCNYRCTYCFEKHLQSDAPGSSSLRIESVKSIFDTINLLKGEKNSDVNRIILYGGEPLNAINKDVIFEIVKQGNLQGFTFSAITNGHDLETFFTLLGEGLIEELQITVDGPKHIHDKRRISLDGNSSFDRVISNMRKIISQGIDVTANVRINVDKYNVGHLGELFETFESEGFLDNTKISIYLAPVFDAEETVATLAGTNKMETEHALTALNVKYENVHVSSTQTNNGTPLLTSLFNNSPFQLKSSFCGATTSTYVFLPDGTISSCMEAIGKTHNTIGCYSADGLQLNDEICRTWLSRSVASIPECLDCRYCLVCAGGCPQHAIAKNGSINTPYCDHFQDFYPSTLADSLESFLSANYV